MHGTNELKQTLADLVLENPRGARTLLLKIVDSDLQALESLLETLRAPGDSRLRHLVANIARNHPQKNRFAPSLLEWRELETDEFARRAIFAALVDVDEREFAELPARLLSLPSQSAELYQYIADRLRHRIRNAMFAAHAQAALLKGILQREVDGDVISVMGKLSDAMTTLGRVVEAIDADPEYFRERPVAIIDWLRQMSVDYAAKYSAIRLTIRPHGAGNPLVYGSNYLLETVFWNIWVNAQQSIGRDCEIMVDFRLVDAMLEIVIVDNGKGFPQDMLGVAFTQGYSTKNVHRGRGLLEVHEAVIRLRGFVELITYEPDDYRIRIRLPVYREA